MCDPLLVRLGPTRPPLPQSPTPPHPHAWTPPQAYQAIRNALVGLYRRQPHRRLTLEEAAAAMRGYDASVLAR
jgi:hypothetical protein